VLFLRASTARYLTLYVICYVYVNVCYFPFLLTCPISMYVPMLWLLWAFCVIVSTYISLGRLRCAAICRKVRIMSEIWGCVCHVYAVHMQLVPTDFINVIYFSETFKPLPFLLSLWHPKYMLLFRVSALCLVCSLNIRNCCCCFWWRECVL
jgi:hypothetical protein